MVKLCRADNLGFTWLVLLIPIFCEQMNPFLVKLFFLWLFCFGARLTSYLSPEAQEITENPHASILFYWQVLNCQVNYISTILLSQLYIKTFVAGVPPTIGVMFCLRKYHIIHGEQEKSHSFIQKCMLLRYARIICKFTWQVRVEGSVEKTSDEEADQYFDNRATEIQLRPLISDQVPPSPFFDLQKQCSAYSIFDRPSP